jgi:hypothetical protein
MAKVYELVLLAMIVGVLGAAIFETVKERFLELGIVGRSTVLLSVAAIASALAYFEENIPIFITTKLVITLPVRSPVYSKIEIPIRGSILGAAVISVSILALGFIGVFRWPVSSSSRNSRLTIFFRAFTIHNPFIFFSSLALVYKAYVINDPILHSRVAFIMGCSAVLSQLSRHVRAIRLRGISGYFAIIDIRIASLSHISGLSGSEATGI